MKLYRRFYDEAIYKDHLVWDDEKATDTIRHGIISDLRPHILAFVDEELAGFISYVFDRSFSTKPCMVLMELYVAPEFRRGALGRGLVGLAILEGQHAGAATFHAPIASGMKAARSLMNMLAKGGFEMMGVIMRKKL